MRKLAHRLKLMLSAKPGLRRPLRLLISAAAIILALLLLIICGKEQVEPDPEIEETPEICGGPEIKVLGPEGEIIDIPLEEFLVGVVAAEMPASFGEAALAAQAVAARTYILASVAGGGRHQGAAVCCDSTCCQAWRDPSGLGERGTEARDRVEAAVAVTCGLALYYEGRLAETPFYSCCGGRSESAAACWGGERPWLISVECAYCGHAPRFCGCKVFALTEAASLLECGVEELRRMELTDYTAGGRVAGVSLGGRQMKGTAVRSALGLNSAAFTWLIQGDRILFATLGFGHGVGLCQYGADGMAAAGFSFEEIVSHYYPGCTLKNAY